MARIDKVPFINITRYENGFLEEITSKVTHLLKTGQFSGGPSIAQCEEDLKNFSESNFCVGCGNGTDAIQLALRAVGLGPGHRVALPEMTFWATFEAIVNVGATPRPIDIQKESLHLSAIEVEKAFRKEKFDALLLVHLYGWAAPDTAAIREFCKREKIILVEDSAQAFGTRLDNLSLIGSAEVATTSFYPAKVLGASGDAGAVFCRDAKIAERVKKLRDHGRMSHYEYDTIGWNSRLGAYEATFLSLALKHLPSRIKQRLHALERYANELTSPSLKILRAKSNCIENGYANVMIVDRSRRDLFAKFLNENGVDTRVIYPGAMSAQPGARSFGAGNSQYSEADEVAHTIINLPCFAGISDPEIDFVIASVQKFLRCAGDS